MQPDFFIKNLMIMGTNDIKIESKITGRRPVIMPNIWEGTLLMKDRNGTSLVR